MRRRDPAANPTGAPVPGGRRLPAPVALLVTLVVALLPAALAPPPAAAHAFLRESDPAANAILPTAPPQITLRFSERLEQSFSRAELYDQTGNTVPGGASRFVDDPYVMIVDVPQLPNGTYSVLWRTLSADDGHTAQGYVAFTVGTQADVQTVIPPTTGPLDAGPPEWLRTASRWLALLGLAGVVAVWPVWVFVLRPAISPAWQAGPDLTRRVRALAAWALGLAVVGSLATLLVQADAVRGDEGLLDGVATTLGETRFGTFWLLRLGLFLIFAAALLACAWWWPKRRRALTVATLLLAAALPVPYSMVAHASAQTSGRATAIAVDVVHLLGASLWVGGLFVLVGGLLPTLPHLTAVGRRTVLGRALPRFSALALIAWAVLGLTGLYSAWLQVGNLDALRETAYGRSLTLKLLLLVPVLLLAAFNLLVVTRRVRRPDEAAGTVWSRRFVASVVAEAALVVLVFLVVGRLTGQPPARDALAEDAGRVAIELEADEQAATLTITPGATGPNHYRLELGEGHAAHLGADTAPPDTEALLRLELPSHETGQKQVELTRAAGNAFEGHGSELSIAGDWELEAIVRRPGEDTWTVTTTLAVATEPPAVDLPGAPWRFGTGGVVGLLLVVAGLAGVVLAWRAGRSSLRKEAAGLGTAALVFGALLLTQAKLESGSDGRTALAAPADQAAIARGEALFAANCVACHGPGGRGDGPAAAGLNPPPADLTAAHTRVHADADYAFWIANGIAGSAMPAFGDELSEAEIADVIAYLRDLQSDAAVAVDAPGPDECRVEPRTLDGLRALASTAAPPESPPPTRSGRRGGSRPGDRRRRQRHDARAGRLLQRPRHHAPPDPLQRRQPAPHLPRRPVRRLHRAGRAPGHPPAARGVGRPARRPRRPPPPRRPGDGGRHRRQPDPPHPHRPRPRHPGDPGPGGDGAHPLRPRPRRRPLADRRCDPVVRIDGGEYAVATTSGRRVPFACTIVATLRPRGPPSCSGSRHRGVLLRAVGGSREKQTERLFAHRTPGGGMVGRPHDDHGRRRRPSAPVGYPGYFPALTLDHLWTITDENDPHRWLLEPLQLGRPVIGEHFFELLLSPAFHRYQEENHDWQAAVMHALRCFAAQTAAFEQPTHEEHAAYGGTLGRLAAGLPGFAALQKAAHAKVSTPELIADAVSLCGKGPVFLPWPVDPTAPLRFVAIFQRPPARLRPAWKTPYRVTLVPHTDAVTVAVLLMHLDRIAGTHAAARAGRHRQLRWGLALLKTLIAAPKSEVGEPPWQPRLAFRALRDEIEARFPTPTDQATDSVVHRLVSTHGRGSWRERTRRIVKR